LLSSLAALYVDGAAVDWQAFDRPYRRHKLALPTSPFDRQRYWVETPTNRSGGLRQYLGSGRTDRPQGAHQHAASAPTDWFYDIRWEPAACGLAPTGELPAPELSGRWLIFADNSGVGEQLAASLRADGERCTLVVAGDRYERLADDTVRINPAVADDVRRLVADLQVAEGEISPCRGIVHLWSLDAPTLEALDLDSLDAAQTRTCGNVVHIAQAVSAAGWREGPRLWLVTRGAQSVQPTPEPVAVAQAPLWGLGRAMALEHAALWGGLIDLDRSADSCQSAAALAAELRRHGPEDQVAFRAGVRLVPRLARVDAVQVDAQRVEVREDAGYLITGGVGGIGLEVARWLVERGARHLLLIGRTRLPDRALWDTIPDDDRAAKQIRALRELEDLGARLYVPAADVGDASQLVAALESAHQAGCPPLRGVVHAAGVQHQRAIVDEKLDTLHDMLRAKVRGGWLLHHVLGEAPLDFFVTFSSASAVMSSPRLGAYAAANTFLDALVHARRAGGQPALSIGWGLWAEVGMSTQFRADDVERAVDRGMGKLTPSQGLHALANLLGQDRPYTAVLPINWQTWAQFYPGLTSMPFFSHVVRAEGAAGRANEPTPTPEQLLAAGEDERLALVEAYLTTQVCQVLRLRPAEFDPRRSLTEFGLDSLMAVELKNRIEAALGLRLQISTVLTSPDLVALAEAVVNRLSNHADSSGEAQPTAPMTLDLHNGMHVNGDRVAIVETMLMQDTADLLSNLDGFSDEQVTQLLGAMLPENSGSHR
ncbi:MAG: beta-ketoacyl reductase, partial [Chloroflexota bacterium]